MADLKDPRLIYLKGLLFLLGGVLASLGVLLETFSWKVMLLLALAVWCFSRFYYFAFYVIEHYVDAGYKFAGLWDFTKYVLFRGDRMPASEPEEEPNPQPTPEKPMFVEDTCVTLVPYFKVNEGQLDAFKALGPKFVEKTKTEAGVIHYAFSFDGLHAHCREGYDDAAGVLAHLENVGAILEEALTLSELARLEVHGPAAELDQLREPLAGLSPQFFVLEAGGIRRG